MSIRQKRRLMLIGGLCVAAVCSPAQNDNVRLLMPPAIYSTPGHYAELYFDNVILVPDVNDYLFDVDGPGRQFNEKWQYKPTAGVTETQKLQLRVMNSMNKVIAKGNCSLHVPPVNAGEGRNITIMILGDSLTDSSHYPNELNRLLQVDGNPTVTFIGSHAGAGKKPDAGHVLHEGRGGWTWASYCTHWTENQTDYRGRSPFMFMKGGTPRLDFQMYCDKKNEGKAPDYIVVFLGCNDIFRAKDDTIERTIDKMFVNADTLLAEFRQVSPNTRIGLLMPIPPNARQTGFGYNYGCSQTRYQYKRNQHRTVERMIKKYGDKEQDNIFLIPAYINIDSVNSYPQNNGVHPLPKGYHQIANSVYAWLKYQLALTSDKKR